MSCITGKSIKTFFKPHHYRQWQQWRTNCHERSNFNGDKCAFNGDTLLEIMITIQTQWRLSALSPLSPSSPLSPMVIAIVTVGDQQWICFILGLKNLYEPHSVSRVRVLETIATV